MQKRFSKTFKNVGLLSVTLAMIAAWQSFAVPVQPNPNSLLKGKRVLVYSGRDLNKTSHETAKAIAEAKLNLIKTAVGITTLTAMDNLGNATFATLNQYDIIVFNYVFDNQLLVGQPFEGAFKQWLASGNRGYVGYHTSGANQPNEWNWYRDSVTSMRYQKHSLPAQEGKLTITTDATLLAEPILKDMPATFTGTDEWYDFDLPPRAPAAPTWNQCKIIYYLDEKTLVNKPDRPMDPHPMAWFREDSRNNRFFYSAFIHSDQGAGSDFFHSMILRAMEYVAGYNTVSVTPIQERAMPGFSASNAGIRVEIGDEGRHRLEVFTTDGKIVDQKTGNGPHIYNLLLKRKGTAFLVKVTTPGYATTRLIPVQ